MPKQKPIIFNTEMMKAVLEGRKTQTRRLKDKYNIGDVLYCQEPWVIGCMPDTTLGWVDGVQYKTDELFMDEEQPLHLYVMDIPDDFNFCSSEDWIPAKEMPRWASRCTLEVIGKKSERLRDISEEDAKNEGVKPDLINGGDLPYTAGFANLWNDIYPIKTGKHWSDNPTVYAYEFKILEVKK